MRVARIVCCTVAALAVLGLTSSRSLHGQTGQSGQSGGTPPTFRATTSSVEVDVTVLDRNGRFVPGLQPDDLELFEDGRPQAIQQFYLVTRDSDTHRSIISSDDPAQAEAHARRVFVIMFDERHLDIDSLMRVKKGAETFVREQIGPGDIGGVFVDGGMYRGRLTTDKNELLSAIRSATPSTSNRDALLAPFREFPRVPGEINATRIANGDQELLDSLGQEACADEPQECRLNGGVEQIENMIQRKARLYVGQASVMARDTIQNLLHVVSGLSHFPGRKTVVLLSEGFYVEQVRATLEMVAAQAARAGTVIYAIDGRGLIGGSMAVPDVVAPGKARSILFDTGEDGPAILAGDTGGFVVHDIDDMSRAFGLIARDTSTYYVLGYQPTNSIMDGKYRKIDVKARVAGLKIRARRGYIAAPLPPPIMERGGGI
jgi:VWFA-related protein